MIDWQEMMNANVLTLGMAADSARRAQSQGNVVTYLRVHVVTADDIRTAAAIPEAASEVRLHETPATLDEAIAQVRALRALAGSRRVAAFSMAAIEKREWRRAEALLALTAAGLDDVAALEIDQVLDAPEAIEALRAAGAQPRRLTVERPVSDRKAAIIQAQQAVAAGGGRLRFAPLPRVAPIDKPTTGYDDLRMVALSRLALGDTSIEIDWSLYGPKLAQVALTFGADHLDAVATTDNPALGRRRATVEDVERNIKAAGFAPQEYRASRGSRASPASGH